MNDLSWLIYFADVAGSFRAFAGVVFGVCLVAGSVSAIASSSYDDEVAALSRTWLRRSLVVGFIVALMGVVAPSQKTVMLIAASEVGEEISQTEQFEETSNKAYQALQKWLDRYLEDENVSKNLD